MDYMDPDDRCPKKAVKLKNLITHLITWKMVFILQWAGRHLNSVFDCIMFPMLQLPGYFLAIQCSEVTALASGMPQGGLIGQSLFADFKPLLWYIGTNGCRWLFMLSMCDQRNAHAIHPKNYTYSLHCVVFCCLCYDIGTSIFTYILQGYFTCNLLMN